MGKFAAKFVHFYFKKKPGTYSLLAKTLAQFLLGGKEKVNHRKSRKVAKTLWASNPVPRNPFQGNMCSHHDQTLLFPTVANDWK